MMAQRRRVSPQRHRARERLRAAGDPFGATQGDVDAYLAGERDYEKNPNAQTIKIGLPARQAAAFILGRQDAAERGRRRGREILSDDRQGKRQ